MDYEVTQVIIQNINYHYAFSIKIQCKGSL